MKYYKSLLTIPNISFVLLRLITAPLVLIINPFWGIFIANFADAFDVVFLSLMKAIFKTRVQSIEPTSGDYRITYPKADKLFDTILLFFMLIAVPQIIPSGFTTFAYVLFALRLCGVIFILITGNRKILLFTPNFFYYYVWLFAFLQLINSYQFTQSPWFYIVVGGLFVFNYGQEIILHGIEYKPWESFKKFIRKNLNK